MRAPRIHAGASPRASWMARLAAFAYRRVVGPRLGCAACLMALLLAGAASPGAHDLERTQVAITFAPDGSFVVDVANDPDWLKLRLESIPGPFADRVVLWVDGREVRPSSVEFIPFDSRRLARGRAAEGLSIQRLRGRMPTDARTLRWFYGLVIDPYPLTIRRADGRIVVEEVQGDAWSRSIDLSGQFQVRALDGRVAGVLVALVILLPALLRFHSLVRQR